MPIRIASGPLQSTMCEHRGVGAVGADQRERERLGRAGACPGRGFATHVNVCTVPRGPTSIQCGPSAATSALVDGSYSVGGTSTRPSAKRTASMRAVTEAGEEATDHGPDRAGVAARILEHVRLFEQFSHTCSQVLRSVREHHMRVVHRRIGQNGQIARSRPSQ